MTRLRALGPSSIPQLQLGDALIFAQFTLHRTQNVGTKKAVRKACEFRFVRGSAPTFQGLSGWVRYKWNNTFSANGVLAAKARVCSIRNRLLHARGFLEHLIESRRPPVPCRVCPSPAWPGCRLRAVERRNAAIDARSP
jgi:hypothetical protein